MCNCREVDDGRALIWWRHCRSVLFDLGQCPRQPMLLSLQQFGNSLSVESLGDYDNKPIGYRDLKPNVLSANAFSNRVIGEQ